MGVAQRGRARRAAVLATRRRRRVDAPALRPRRADPARRTRAARVLVRSRRVRRAGRAGDSPPRPSGRSPRRARRSPTANLWHDGPHRFAPAPGGHARRRRERPRRAPDARRRVGVDRVRLRSRTRASARSRTASTPRCSSAPTTRCCAAARGPRTPPPCRTTFRNWDFPIRRQIFAGFRCAPRRLMCRHLAYLGRPSRSTSCSSTRRTSLARQAEHPRHQRVGRHQPRRVGRRLVRPRSAASPSRYRTTTPIWDDADFAASAATLCAARSSPRLASRHRARAWSTAGNAPFVAGRWAFSLNGIVDGFTDGSRRRRCGRGSPRDRRAGLVGDTDTEVLFALGARAASTRATPPPTRSRRWCTTCSQVTTGRLNLLLTDGTASTRRGGQLAVPRASRDRLGAARRRRRLDRGRPTAPSPCSTTDGTSTDQSRSERTGHDHRRHRRRAPRTRRDRARARSRRPRRARRDAEDAAAEVVLRRSRQRALRRDHPTARVLPDPHRARRSSPSTRPTSPSSPRPTRSSSSARARPRRRACSSTRCATPARSSGSCRSTSASRPSATPRRRSPPSTRAYGARGRRRLRAPPRATCPDGGTPTRRVPRQHDRQPRRPSRARGSSPTSRAALAPGDALLLGTDLVKDADRLVAAYDDAAGVTAAFNRNVLAVLEPRARRRLRSRRRSTTSRSATPSTEWIEMRLRSPARPDRARATPSTSTSSSRPARSCAPRSAPSSGANGVEQRARRRRASTSPSGGPTPRATSRCRSRSYAEPMGYRRMTDEQVRDVPDPPIPARPGILANDARRRTTARSRRSGTSSTTTAAIVFTTGADTVKGRNLLPQRAGPRSASTTTPHRSRSSPSRAR